MTRGMKLEQRLESFCSLNQIPCAHASVYEDRFKAIDFHISGLPVQVTLGKWKTKLDLAKVRQKWEWTKIQSQNSAILCVFDMESNQWVTMFKNMVKGLYLVRKHKLTEACLLISEENVQICTS